MLASSEITDAPREAARAMLQLLFLMVHSLADQVPAKQVKEKKSLRFSAIITGAS